MMNNERFHTIINGVDKSLPIIIDTNTGFYNITKIRNIVVERLKNDDKITNTDDYKKITKYFDTKGNQKLINDIKDVFMPGPIGPGINNNKIYYALNKNVTDDFRGTYVHKKLFEHICMWIDNTYYFKITDILQKEHDLVNVMIIKQKDDKIDQLIKMNKRIEEHCETINKRSEKLLQLAEDQGIKLDKANTEITVISNHLDDKSFKSTMNPNNTQLHHHFLTMFHITKNANGANIYNFKMISGQKKYINKEISRYNKMNEYNSDNDIDEEYVFAYGPHYNANGIDLRNNIKSAVNEYIYTKLKTINNDLKEEVDIFNAELYDEIFEDHKKIIRPIKKILAEYEKMIEIMNTSFSRISRKKIIVNKTNMKRMNNLHLMILSGIELINSIIEPEEHNMNDIIVEFNNKKLRSIMRPLSDLIDEANLINLAYLNVEENSEALRKLYNKLFTYRHTFSDYDSDKQVVEEVTIDELNINVSALSIQYNENDYIKYKDIIKIIRNVNTDTQINPHN